MTEKNSLIIKYWEKLTRNAYHSNILDFLHTGIALVDNRGVFLRTNKSFVEIFKLPQNVNGLRVADMFLTAEQGVMTTIRTQKAIINPSVTKENTQGVSFRYPVLDSNGELLGVVIESVPVIIGDDRLLDLLITIHDLKEEVRHLKKLSKETAGSLSSFKDILGDNEAILALKNRGRLFAKRGDPILLVGESGTGKELIAQALHSASPRAEKPFVVVNCAALPNDLIESELFGYEKGAFTGAKSDGYKGKFELADKGTIFLDEIGELSLPLQAKLLRVLESGEIQKIAHGSRLFSDFRLIVATNKDLAKMVSNGLFRNDLYHRINVLELEIAPLRERTSDIPLLTRHFIEEILGLTRGKQIGVSNEVYQLFALYSWPGNVRELKNVLTYALYALEENNDNENVLKPYHLPNRLLFEIQKKGAFEVNGKPQPEEQKLAEISAQAESKAILDALIRTKYNKTKTARVLNISRNKLYKKMRDLNF